MRRLFHPTDGIGLSFVRNPIGASDLSRPGNVSLDDTCCNLNDFGANGYDTNVRLLTQQARQLNPALRVKGVPWSAPGWMKDNGRMDQMGWLQGRVLPDVRPVLRQVRPELPGRRRADQLRLGAERAQLLPGRQPDRR